MATDAAPARSPLADPPAEVDVILSFDVEGHDRIEAASSLEIPDHVRDLHRGRVAPVTRWILASLEARGVKATFFVLGTVARDDPGLVREIHSAGHEVASHGWDHRRVLAMTPEEFREDLRRSRDALESACGERVVGYRAPTFSIVAETHWALDVLAEEGFLYDSSIYPVRHDRYGVPAAPRAPFLARGASREILEIPPATLRLRGLNLPVGGGGYFRLFPPALLARAVAQARRECRPPVVMLYFHPWEFDPGQPRLPLRRAGRFRTYVGIGRSRGRLERLLAKHRFARAADVARAILEGPSSLPTFAPGGAR